jgi:WD40 repeat protein
VTYSADGKYLASGDENGTVRVWNVKNGSVVLCLKGQGARVEQVSFCKEESLVCSASTKGIIAWRFPSGHKVRTLGAISTFQAVALSPNGKQAAGLVDRQARVWELANGAESAVIPIPGKSEGHLIFTPDGRYLILPDGTKCHAKTGQSDPSWARNTHYPCVFSRQGDRVAFGVLRNVGASHDLLIQETAKGVTEIRFDSSHVGHIFDLAFSPDGRRLASASAARSIKVWDLASQQVVCTCHDRAVPRCVCFSPDGIWLAAGCGQTVRIWETQKSAEKVYHLGGASSRNNVVFSPGENRFAVAPGNGVYDSENGSQLVRTVRHWGKYYRVTFSRDGKFLASPLKLWEASSGKVIHDFTTKVAEPYGGGFGRGGFSPDGKWFAAADGRGKNNRIRVFSTISGEVIQTLDGFDDLLSFQTGTVFSPDGRLLATAGASQIARVAKGFPLAIFDTTTWKKVRTLRTFSCIWGLAFSPDGKYLAAACGDRGDNPLGEVLLWDVTTGKECFFLVGYTHPVWEVAFSPDSRRLATASGHFSSPAKAPGLVKLWDLQTRQELLSLGEQIGTYFGVDFSPDGTRLIAADGKGTIRIWEGPRELP